MFEEESLFGNKAFIEGFPFPCALLEYDTTMPKYPDLIARSRNYIAFIQGKAMHIIFTRIGPREKIC